MSGLKFFSFSLIATLLLTLQARAEDHKSKHEIRHVLLISVDGMHALDLTNYISNHPNSTLAQLSAHGNTYTNATTLQPSDSFPE